MREEGARKVYKSKKNGKRKSINLSLGPARIQKRERNFGPRSGGKWKRGRGELLILAGPNHRKDKTLTGTRGSGKKGTGRGNP